MIHCLRLQVPEKIVHSATQLLVSICTTVRPEFLLDMPDVQKLYNDATNGVFSTFPHQVNIMPGLPMMNVSTKIVYKSCSNTVTRSILQTQLLLYRSLSNYLLLAWPNVSDAKQKWPQRSSSHLTFISKITADFCQLRHSRLSDNKHLQEHGEHTEAGSGELS